MADLTWSFSQAFASEFQSSTSGLQSRIDEAKLATSASEQLIQELSADLAKITKSLADATGSLPSYDQRQYEDQLKALEKSVTELQSRSRPKPKFSFKRNLVASSPSTSSPNAEKSNIKPDTAVMSPPDRETPAVTPLLSSRTHEYLTFESLPVPTPRDITIYGLNQCIVNLIPLQQHNSLDGTYTTSPELSSVHITKLSNTVLILPPIAGSVLIHDLMRCTIIVGCHQFRVHNSENVDVYLSAASNPIIEHCSNMRFGGYPDILSAPTKNKSSSHLSVLDFSHIKSTPSPNWVTFNDDPLEHQWPLPVNMIDQNVLDLLLDRLLPSTIPNS